jgi:hypothetical protein
MKLMSKKQNAESLKNYHKVLHKDGTGNSDYHQWVLLEEHKE